jgi:FkbM family methyltransferase
LERELRLRAGTSDLSVFFQVFDAMQYCTSGLERDRDLHARYQTILERGRRPLIIDAGANIGLTAMYYRDVYPDSVIVCVEPEAGNFAELSRHLAGDPLVVLLQAALAPADGNVKVVDPGWGEWGFRTEETTEDSTDAVPAFSIESVVNIASERWPVVPFILKVDIEGFEARLFDGSGAELVNRFYGTLIELHDWLLPRQKSSAGFLKAVAGRDRDFLILGESILSVSNADPRA